jgi:hypothetical protein
MSNDFFENRNNAMEFYGLEPEDPASGDFFQNVFGAAADAHVTAEKAKDKETVVDDKTQPDDKYKKYTSSKFYEYPTSVGMTPEQPHSVVFNINVRENSRVASLASAENAANINAAIAFYGGIGDAGDSANLKSAEDTSQNTLNKDQLETGNSVAVGLGGALLGVGFVGAVGKAPASTLGLGVGAALGGVGATLAKSVLSSLQTQGTVRTLGAITLHVAAPPIAQYSANWENKELGSLAALGSKFLDDDGGVSSASVIEGLKGSADTLGRSAIKAAAKLPSEIGITGDIGSIIDLSTGKILNPYKEQLFNSMGFRQFAFNYKFNPKDINEYNNVRAIIETFKYHMHPERVNDGLFLQYPSEFEIEYKYKGAENTHISKISTCALTDLKVTYGNQDSFTTVQGTNGAPAEINLQLGFTELEILSNERIADGY